jgi:hypothetical protein
MLDRSVGAGLFVVVKREVIAPDRNIKFGHLRYHIGEIRQSAVVIGGLVRIGIL